MSRGIAWNKVQDLNQRFGRFWVQAHNTCTDCGHLGGEARISLICSTTACAI